MKYSIAVVLFFVAAFSSMAVDQIRVKATKQLDGRKNSGNQQAFGGHTSLTQKEYYYRFDVQAVSPQVANPLKFEWVVMFEDWEGRMRPGTTGTCETNISMTKVTAVESDTVHLNQRNWQGPGGHSGKIEDKIAGYGLRVTDKNGNIIDEEYDPSSLKRSIDWKMIGQQPNEDALKAIQTLLGGGQRPPPPPPQRPRHP